MIKRIIAMLTALNMLAAAGFSAVYANEYQSESIQNKINFVEALEIMHSDNDGNFMPDSFITRLDTAEIAVKMRGIQPAGSTEPSFSDIALLTDEEKATIEFVSGSGFMRGFPDGTFGAEEYVSYNEFMKVMVCVLGYGIPAEQNGGYPNGYAMQASELRITDSAAAYRGDEPITKGHAALFVYNALKAPCGYYKTNGSGVITLERGKSLLEEVHHIYKKSGYVDGIDRMTVKDGIVPGKNRALIDGNIYGTKNISPFGLIGRKVDFWYYFGDSEQEDYTIVYLITDDEDIESFSADEIVSYSDYCYKYGGEKTKTFRFSKASDIIYNFREVKSPSEEIFKNVNSGEIYGFDADGDGIADRVYINSYETYCIGRINAETKTIYDKYGKSKNICLDSGRERVNIFNKAGEDVLFEELSENTVFSAAVSYDGKYVYAVICNDTVSGTIEEISEENGKTTVKTDFGEYTVEKKFAEYKEKYALNKKGIFYLNFNGEISGAEADDINAAKYGYLVKTGEAGSADKTLQCRIFKDNGEFENFTLEEKIIYEYKGEKSRINTFVSGEANKLLAISPQLIRYKTAADGKINYVAVAASYGPDTKAAEYRSGFRKMLYTAAGDSKPMYKKNGNQAGGKAVFDDEALLFVVPDSDMSREEEYMVGTMPLLANLEYDVVPYTSKNDSEKSEVGVLAGSDYLVRSVTGGLSSSRLMVISKITDTVNADGEAVKRISGYRDGAFETYNTRYGSTADGAEVGDVIQIGLINSTDINDIYIVYDRSRDKFNHDANPYFYSQGGKFDAYIRVGAGIAYSCDGELLRVSYGTREELPEAKFVNLDLVNAQSYKITVVEKDRVRMGSADDIDGYINGFEGDRLVISTHSANPGIIAVYKD